MKGKPKVFPFKTLSVKEEIKEGWRVGERRILILRQAQYSLYKSISVKGATS
jgi:hypothetical protein